MEFTKKLQEAYQILLSSDSVVFLWKNAAGWPVEFVSDNVLELFGYTQEDFISGRVSYSSIIHPDDLKRVNQEVARHREHPETTRFHHQPYRIITAGSEIKWLDDRTHLRRDPDGRITHYQGVVSDITDRVRDEEKHQLLALAVEHNPSSIIITDAKGTISYVNSTFCRITGYTREESIGRNPRILQSGKMSAAFYKDLWKTVLSGNIWQGEFINKKKNGEEYWERASIAPLKDANGRPTHLVAIKEDITEQKELQMAVKQNEYRLQKILATANEGYGFSDNNSFITDANDALCRILARNRDEIIGRSIFDFVDNTNKKIFQEQVARRAQGKSNSYEIILSRPDGSEVPCLFNATPFHDQIGNKQGAFAIITDITERKRTEDELRQAKKEAERANELKTLFLSSVSHEIRTPLNSIQGFAQLMAADTDPPLSHRQREHLQRIIISGDHLLDLINDILDLAKIESGVLELHIQTVDVQVVLRQAVDFVEQEAALKGIQFILSCRGPQQKPTPCIHADPFRLKQVILNLLSNAIKYNRESGSVSVSCQHLVHGQIRINVTDTGPGIAPEKFPYIFTPFNRLGFEASEIEGTGIGLCIVKNLVKMMNGTIDFTSEVGKGTTFFLDFPAADPVETTSPAPTSPVKEAEIPLPDRQIRLLYIEDNLFNRQLFEAIIDQYPNITLIEAADGQQGLTMARRHRPDVILSDIFLPDIDGYEVRKQLLENEETRHIPVIALSANAMEQDIQKGLTSGFQGYITKPINIGKLFQAIAKVLEGKY